MNTANKKVIAIIEVVLVRFAIFPLLFWLVTKLLPNFQTWQTERLGLPFPVLGHILMVVVSFFVLFVTKRDFASYGIKIRPLKYHLDITGTCFVPVVLASIPFGLGIDYRNWSGAWILAIVQVVLLFVLGWMLKKQPSAGQVSLLALSWITLASGIAGQSIGKAFAEFVTYGVFVGFGEEIIFRGYMQSRLNDAFGRPYQFFGIKYGWGIVIASALFGLTHVGLTQSLLTDHVNLHWAWGFWTFFGGLVFGLVREKSESILAPALLHGLPQAIASAVMV
ncbi:MAG: CPBP family intramembrane metalloprotease, partial [Chloroflexi bacterium]|nr:CPBP family intramembrane metalloprotease [Chloroflexota bacterium]